MKFDFKKMGLSRFSNNSLGGLLVHLVLAFGIICLIAVLYFYVYLPNITNHGESITVPSIEGLHIDKVDDFLAKHDLRYEVNDSSYSSEYAPLTVLKQYPSAGTKVKENRKIYVSINRVNPPTVPMPDLIDGSLINAEAVLRGSELRRGKIQLVRGPFLNVVQEMRVGGNKIVPGVRIPKGTVIDLVVMDGGSDKLPTPNVLKLSYGIAEFNILGSNLYVGKVTLIGDTTGINAVVIKQKPLPHENIRVGDGVDLWIGPADAVVADDDDGTSDDPDQ